jgi:hypothetical protein
VSSKERVSFSFHMYLPGSLSSEGTNIRQTSIKFGRLQKIVCHKHFAICNKKR